MVSIVTLASTKSYMAIDVLSIAEKGSKRTIMKKTIALMLMTSVWLGGCSGRTDDTGDVDPNDPLVIAAAQAQSGSIRVLTTKPSLLTGTGDTAGIIAIVTDEDNRVVPDQEVVFSSDGGVLQNILSTTSDAGEAKADLSLAGDYRNGNITVTATLGNLDASVLVAATGTTMQMIAPETLIRGDAVPLVFSLTDGGGQAVPNQIVSFVSEVGNTFDQNNVNTDANGIASVVVSTNQGADTITAVTLDGAVSQDFPLAVVENIQAVVTPIRVRVISNESAIETGGNDIARITTLVTDDNNRVISGKSVEFSSTGGVLQNISAVTNDAGQATAELSLAGDYRNQNITVTAKVDDEEGSVLLSTSGSTISIAGPTALVNGNTAQLEITLTGGNDQAIANELVSISSLAGNTLSTNTATTDAAGKVVVSVDSDMGTDQITVSALDDTVTKTHDINVAADILTVLNPADHQNISVDLLTLFQVEWISDGAPVAGEEVKFTITAGEVRAPGDTVGTGSVIVATDSSGIATIEVKSNAAGPATVAFSDADDTDPFSQFDIEFVAVQVSNMEVEAAPASVATGNASSIYATVTDDFGNPVKNVAVEFSSANLKGGNLSPVTAVTDSDGKARITFTAGAISSEENELIIEATATDMPSVSSTVSITVTERQLNVIIGLAGTVTEADTDTRYRKAGLVQVTDGAGRPVPDANIVVSMIPTVYRYGKLFGVDTDNNGEPDAWARLDSYSYACESEDKNNNRVLDLGEDSNGNGLLDQGEDANQNGRLDINEDVNNFGVLDPSDPGLVDSDPVNQPTVIGGQITTDANGVGFFSLAYPQSNAWWFDVRINARVQALGVEVVADYDTGLSALATDVNDYTIEPPNLYSPYGELDLEVVVDPVTGAFRQQAILDSNGRPASFTVPITCDQPSREIF